MEAILAAAGIPSIPKAASFCSVRLLVYGHGPDTGSDFPVVVVTIEFMRPRTRVIPDCVVLVLP